MSAIKNFADSMISATETDTTATAGQINRVLGKPSLILHVPTMTLKTLFQRVLFTTDDKNGRYALDNVQLSFSPAGITATATDGRQLATSTILADLPVVDNDGFSVLIPRKIAKSVVKRVTSSATSDTMKISIFDTDHFGDLIRMEWSGYRNRAKHILIDTAAGRFPKWRDLVSNYDKSKTKISTTAGELKTAINSVTESAGFDFSFDSEDTGLKISRTAATAICNVDGAPLSICLNADYVSGFLSTLDDNDDVFIFANNADEKMIFVSPYSEYVLMPLAKDRRNL